ncbi:MAG: endonuclease III [Proteobacteria bacterium]|nr:endonuclease III [Cystobacterineae bacterium]MCL2259098.1 endonuclease III [Cystobacterineae bacterium]MCL2314491.1 endonuclease III [Pseudomonadota bacterium]
MRQRPSSFPSARLRAKKVSVALKKSIPHPQSALHFETPLQLLVAVCLSAQCRDERVNAITPQLFGRFPSIQSYAEAEVADIVPYIRSLGLFRNKAQNLVAMGKALLMQHGGQIPLSRAALESLPGVGRKTAGVVSMHLGGEFAFPVDTHIARVARRLGLSQHTHPNKIEEALQKLFPREEWLEGHHRLLLHGRHVCKARKPECGVCSLRLWCPQAG